MKLKCGDLKSTVRAEVNQLRRAMQDADLEYPGSSSTIKRLDNTERLSSGSDLYKSLGTLISKLEPIDKFVDDISRVSQ